MWKDFLYFPKQQKLGLLLLSVLILVLLAVSIILDTHRQNTPMVEYNPNEELQYQEFIASIQKKEQLIKQVKQKKSRRFTLNSKKLFPFNPNTADSSTLLSLGIPQWMIHNIIKYRTKGGYFKTPENFRKIYGLTEENFQLLLPYLTIESKHKKTHQSTFSFIDSSLIDSSKKKIEKVIKFKKVTPIDLNQADTTLLKMIPGIGSYIAKKIINYKKKIGGFYNIEQLKEIQLKADSLKKWFTIDESKIQRININRSSLNRLKSHPYINFYQAKAIVEYRKRKGKIKDLRVFSLYEEFTPKDFERLSHYICY